MLRWDAISLALVVFIAPLLGAPERLAHPSPWIAAFAAYLMMATQPVIGTKEMTADPDDRRSSLGIFVAQIGSGLASVLQFGYRDALMPAPVSVWVGAGFLVWASSMAFRIWAIRTLGEFFTSTVKVQPGQTVCDRGPYKLLRHPSYTGALGSAFGVAIACASPIGAAIALLCGVPAYLYRIAVEERALVAGLGQPYDDYRRRSYSLVPFVY